jgi:hypothetical protein
LEKGGKNESFGQKEFVVEERGWRICCSCDCRNGSGRIGDEGHVQDDLELDLEELGKDFVGDESRWTIYVKEILRNGEGER